MSSTGKLPDRIMAFLEEKGFFTDDRSDRAEVSKLLGVRYPGTSSSMPQKGKILQIHVDGSADLGKQQAGLGGVFQLDGQEIYTFSEPRPGLTNNEAEYDALIHALELAVQFEVDGIEVYSDSQLMVNQINGLYKVKNERLKPRYARIMKLLQQRPFIQFTHVYRNENKHADRLAKEALKTAVETARNSS